MELIFQKLMLKKSDKELEDYLINIKAYSREIVEAAISEMKNRGRVFTEDELTVLETKIQERENTIGKNTITVRNSLDKNIVEDKSATAFYSRKTIYWSTLFFGTIVGSILMVLNFKNTEKKKGIISVLLFGFVYSFLEVYILFFLENMTTIQYKSSSYFNLLGLILNGFGAFVMGTLFWNKFIGKDFKYRKKTIWLPILLGIIVDALLFLFWLSCQNEI
jgi:hypothetical protein